MDMKFLKKNKFTFFIIIFFLILFVLLLQAKNLFFPNSGKANYGERLNGIAQIKQDTIVDIENTLKENENVVDVSITVNGRIINTVFTVQDSVLIAAAKTIGESIKDSFDEAVLKDYDLQVFMKKNDAKENDFPIIGYKSKLSDGFTWTRDRAKTVEEEPKQ